MFNFFGSQVYDLSSNDQFCYGITIFGVEIKLQEYGNMDFAFLKIIKYSTIVYCCYLLFKPKNKPLGIHYNYVNSSLILSLCLCVV